MATASPSRAWSGSTGTAPAPRSTPPWSGTRPQPGCQPQGQPAGRRSRQPGRYLQLRGDAELITDGALAHLDGLTRKYTRHPASYGHIYPAAQRARETRVICRIHARRITLDAIHARARPNRCTEEAPAKPAGPEAYGGSSGQHLEAT